MQRLASGLGEALGIPIELLSLEDAALAAYGLLGSRPTIAGSPYLAKIALHARSG